VIPHWHGMAPPAARCESSSCHDIDHLHRFIVGGFPVEQNGQKDEEAKDDN